MSTTDELYSLRDTLYKAGLLETLCFMMTMGDDWWYFQDDTLIYSHWNSTGKCDGIIDFCDAVSIDGMYYGIGIH